MMLAYAVCAEIGSLLGNGINTSNAISSIWM